MNSGDGVWITESGLEIIWNLWKWIWYFTSISWDRDEMTDQFLEMEYGSQDYFEITRDGVWITENGLEIISDY